MQWWIIAPLPLKVAYFGLACAVVFGLAAAIVGIEFGRAAEDQVVEVTEDLLTIASLGGGPVLVMGLISSVARRRRRVESKRVDEFENMSDEELRQYVYGNKELDS